MTGFSRDKPQTTAPGRPPASYWDAFRHKAFAMVWLATIVSNVGTWMYNAAAGWLMTSLSADPFTVSLVQVASSLPLFLFALPAGALADIIDRRRYLIIGESLTTTVAVISALFVSLNLMNPHLLLLFIFLLSVGAALTAPAWQSIVPMLVPKRELASAVTSNSVGINISRATGPALGGIVIGILGIAAPFWINAVSNLGVIGVLLWWRPPLAMEHALPAERLWSALMTGFRHARYNPDLRATLIRAVAFFFFASAYWALLPLVARQQIAGGPALYGILLGAIGAGAVGGALALPNLKKICGPDRVVALGTVGTAATLVLLGLARTPVLGLLACILAGLSWIVAIANLNVSAQISLPDWVRGRGLAVFVTAFFGAMTIGSAVWGEVAAHFGLTASHFLAAALALTGIPLTWRWKLQTSAQADLTPSMHWPNPILAIDAEPDRGPVLVTIEYQIEQNNRAAFLVAINKLGQSRRRDGAYAWDVFEDAAAEGRFLETFQVASWLEHLRQHQRVTNADRIVQDNVRRLAAGTEPKVTHFMAADLRL